MRRALGFVMAGLILAGCTSAGPEPSAPTLTVDQQLEQQLAVAGVTPGSDLASYRDRYTQAACTGSEASVRLLVAMNRDAGNDEINRGLRIVAGLVCPDRLPLLD